MRSEAGSALSEQSALGNAALMAQLGPESEQVGHSDAIREFAAPLVERTMFALQVLPRDAAEVARFVEIVDRSNLPDKDRLLARLQGNQDVALGIEAAMRDAFGATDEALRSDLVSLLDAVWQSVQDGDAPIGDATVGERAESWVADLAAEQVSEKLTERLGPEADIAEAVRTFSRQVYLALALDEEEEEESSWDLGPVEE